MQLQPFALTACRLSPLFLNIGFSPIARFPGIVRLIALLVLSIAITQLLSRPWQLLSQASWIMHMMLEFGLGMLMVIGFQLAYAAILMVGRMLDMQIGFAAAGVIDPVSNNNDPLIGTILSLFVTLAIFVTNTHYDILAIALELFRLIPVGTWDGTFSFSSIMAYFFTQFSFAFGLLGPVIMGLWLMDIFNGAVAKTMPQMNVYFVMLPLKIGVGIFLLASTATLMKPGIQNMFDALLVWFSGGWQ